MSTWYRILLATLVGPGFVGNVLVVLAPRHLHGNLHYLAAVLTSMVIVIMITPSEEK
jgi:hypothetical protein